MAKQRTALGRLIDISELISKNEKTRAVGNMKVNARGDTIDAHGKIIEPVTNKVNDRYSKTVGNRSAQPVRNPRTVKQARPGNEPGVTPKPVKTGGAAPKPVVKELTQEERDLESDLDSDLEIEKIKEQETRNYGQKTSF